MLIFFPKKHPIEISPKFYPPTKNCPKFSKILILMNKLMSVTTGWAFSYTGKPIFSPLISESYHNLPVSLSSTLFSLWSI